jgi:hypothetical protein
MRRDNDGIAESSRSRPFAAQTKTPQGIALKKIISRNIRAVAQKYLEITPMLVVSAIR